MGLAFLNIRTYYKLTGIETCGIGIEVYKQTKGTEPQIKPEIYGYYLCGRGGTVMTGFEACFPQIWHLGILNNLNGRNLSNDNCRKDSLTFP